MTNNPDSVALLKAMSEQGWNAERIEAAVSGAVLIMMRRNLRWQRQRWEPVTRAICDFFREKEEAA